MPEEVRSKLTSSISDATSTNSGSQRRSVSLTPNSEKHTRNNIDTRSRRRLEWRQILRSLLGPSPTPRRETAPLEVLFNSVVELLLHPGFGLGWNLQSREARIMAPSMARNTFIASRNMVYSSNSVKLNLSRRHLRCGIHTYGRILR